jgi:hypothetical protein
MARICIAQELAHCRIVVLPVSGDVLVADHAQQQQAHEGHGQ